MTISHPYRLPHLGLVISLLPTGILAAPMVRVDARLGRRGEGSNPYTGDPAAIPTTPPSSSYNHGVPTIDGSEGGFIGLVVGLGILVIACCVAVFFLLKHRRSRRTSPRGRDGPSVGGLGPSYDAKTSFPRPGSHLFGGGKQKKGWLQTGDGGDYDGGIELSGGKRQAGPYLSSDASGAFSSASTVRLAPPGGGLYGDAFSPSPSVENLVSPHSGDGRGDRTPTGVHSGEMYQAVGVGQAQGGDEVSPTSAVTRASFEGGTRFRESF